MQYNAELYLVLSCGSFQTCVHQVYVWRLQQDFSYEQSHMNRIGQTMYIRCIHGVLGQGNYRYTVIYGVYIQVWPTI